MATSAITNMPQPPVVVQTFEKLEDKVAFVVNERAQILSKVRHFHAFWVTFLVRSFHPLSCCQVRASTVRALDAASVSTQRRKESVDEGASESGSAAAASRSSEVSAAIARKRASYTTTPFPGTLLAFRRLVWYTLTHTLKHLNLRLP